MNITLALLIYLCIYMNINFYVTNEISADTSTDVLNSYGLQVGDKIVKINGQKIYNDEDITRIIQSSKSNDFSFVIENPNGKIINKDVFIENKELGYAGIVFDSNGVYELIAGEPGALSGIMAGDIITSINDVPINSVNDCIDLIQNNPNKTLDLKVNRNNEEVEISLQLKSIFKRDSKLKYVYVKDLDFIHNLGYAWNETKYYLRANIIGILELVSGKMENVEVQGIVGISSQISKTESFIEFFYMMSAISMSLGIMNLFPIPGLDGGKILITLIELVRRKPMKKETEAKITLIGFAFLLMLMFYVTFTDISKLFT